MKKLLYVTNIPTPYRNKRFNILKEELEKEGISLLVYYMADNEPNREWKIDPKSYQYEYEILKGLHPAIFGMYAHFNPGLFVRLLFTKYHYAVIGGMGCPSHWFAPFFIFGKTKILSVESNMDSVIIKSGLGYYFKKLLISKYHNYQITGNRSLEYLKYFKPNLKGNFVTLPNIIDEEKYRNEVNKRRENRLALRTKFGISDEKLWLCPSRLEKIKGIHLLLPLLKHLKGVKLFIVGSGSMRDELDSMIKQNNLPVSLLGYQQEDQMLDLYASADLFVLPSLSDPSPLSPIEAIAAGLPIAVSNRIGNHDDVFNGKNGITFDIKDPILTKTKLHEMSIISDEEQIKMSRESSKVYLNNFDSRSLIYKYVQSIKEMV